MTADECKVKPAAKDKIQTKTHYCLILFFFFMTARFLAINVTAVFFSFRFFPRIDIHSQPGQQLVPVLCTARSPARRGKKKRGQKNDKSTPEEM